MDRDVNFAEVVRTTTGEQKSSTESFAELPCSLFVVEKSIDKQARRLTALASAGSLDRDGEIIKPEAFRELLPVYMRNPVVITSHQHRLETGHSSVIANVVEAKISKEGLLVVIEFVEGTALGDEYWLLYSSKKQRSFSVGFAPKEWEFEEINGQRVKVYTRVELLEISCVAVPAHPDALSRSKQRKADFIAAKRAEREEREDGKMLAEIRKNNPRFDEDITEFGEMIYAIDDIEGEVPDGSDLDFAKIVSGKERASRNEFAEMFR